jgi:hypothetical protein
MLLLADSANQSSVILAACPVILLPDAEDYVAEATATPTVGDIAVNKFVVLKGSTNSVKLKDAATLVEGDTNRLHNSKSFNVMVTLSDGVTKLDTIPAGTERTYVVSGGKWIRG